MGTRTRCKQNFSICWFVGWIQFWDCSKRWYFMRTHSEDSQKETKGDSKRTSEKIEKNMLECRHDPWFFAIRALNSIFICNEILNLPHKWDVKWFEVLVLCLGSLHSLTTKWKTLCGLSAEILAWLTIVPLFQHIMWVRSKMSSILTSFYAASTPVDFLFIGGPKSKAIPGTNRLPYQSNFFGNFSFRELKHLGPTSML